MYKPIIFDNNFDLSLIASKKINAAAMPYLNAISIACTTCKQRHVKFSHRLAKVAQTAQKKCATSTLCRCKVQHQQGVISSRNHCYIFAHFS